MLSYAHTSLYYVYHVVAELLAFLDDIHVHGTDGIGVEMVVYIVDVLTLQLVAIVVDLVLDVEREVRIVVPLMTYESDVHLGEGIIRKLHHLMHVLSHTQQHRHHGKVHHLLKDFRHSLQDYRNFPLSLQQY